jgi:hypothetical protein
MGATWLPKASHLPLANGTALMKLTATKCLAQTMQTSWVSIK